MSASRQCRRYQSLAGKPQGSPGRAPQRGRRMTPLEVGWAAEPLQNRPGPRGLLARRVFREARACTAMIASGFLPDHPLPIDGDRQAYAFGRVDAQEGQRCGPESAALGAAGKRNRAHDSENIARLTAWDGSPDDIQGIGPLCPWLRHAAHGILDTQHAACLPRTRSRARVPADLKGWILLRKKS
jgi:hypothetical protein